MQHKISINVYNSPSIKSCCNGLDDPLEVVYLEGKQHKMSGVIQIHGALRIHDAMSRFGPHAALVVFGGSRVHSKWDGGTVSINTSLA